MNTARTTLLAAAATAFALGATFAYAQESSPQIFDQWDADKDGTITLVEVETRRGDIFTSFDANEDGFLVAEETKLMDEMRDNQQEGMQGQGMGQHKAMGMGKHMGMGQGQGMGLGGQMGMNNDPGHGPNGHMGFDADKDGKVSKVEFIGQSKDWLAKFDRNGDGNVNKSDFGL